MADEDRRERLVGLVGVQNRAAVRGTARHHDLKDVAWRNGIGRGVKTGRQKEQTASPVGSRTGIPLKVIECQPPSYRKGTCRRGKSPSDLHFNARTWRANSVARHYLPARPSTQHNHDITCVGDQAEIAIGAGSSSARRQ
jgi:hypothetical protein